MSRASILVLSGCVLAFACTRHETQVEHTYDAFDGGAPYVDTRPKITLPPGDFAIVPSSGSDTLTVVDLAAGKAIARSPVGRSPVVLDGPHQIAADMAKRVAYVVHSYPGAIESAGNHSHGSSTRAGWVQALALDDLRAVGEVEVDPNPGEIAVSDDGKKVVVTHYDLTAALAVDKPIESRRSTLALIDPNALLPFGAPLPDKLLVCVAPHGLTLSRPDGAKAFVACYGEDAVAVVDLADINTPVVRVPAGAGTGPYGVALSPDGTRVAVGTLTSHDVRFLDVAKSAMEPLVVPALGEVYVPAWTRDGTGVYVPTRSLDAVTLVDAASGAVKTRRVFDAATCVAPLEVAFGNDVTVVHVLCEGTAQAQGALVTLDATTLETRARVEVGFFPGRPFVGHGP